MTLHTHDRHTGRQSLVALAFALTAVACSGAPWFQRKDQVAMSIAFRGTKGMSTKWDLKALTEDNRIAFRHSGAQETTGGVSPSSLLYVPEYVVVTWREEVESGKPRESGRIAARYVVPVKSRIPAADVEHVRKGRRALQLIFEIHDDGVRLAWEVMDIIMDRRAGRIIDKLYSRHGGDFPCDPMPPDVRPSCTEGPLEKAWWYDPYWHRDR